MNGTNSNMWNGPHNTEQQHRNPNNFNYNHRVMDLPVALVPGPNFNNGVLVPGVNDFSKYPEEALFQPQQKMNLMPPQYFPLTMHKSSSHGQQNLSVQDMENTNAVKCPPGYPGIYPLNANNLVLAQPPYVQSFMQGNGPSIFDNKNMSLANIPPVGNYISKSRPFVPIPNINATASRKSSVSSSPSAQVTSKYKKPNRIFIACTHCHKSKIRCLQLSEDEIATLPQVHIKHMVQLIGKPTKKGSVSSGEEGRVVKPNKLGINYPCKRCYNTNKICVYDHSRIGRGRKPKAAKKVKQESDVAVSNGSSVIDSHVSANADVLAEQDNPDCFFNKPLIDNQLKSPLTSLPSVTFDQDTGFAEAPLNTDNVNCLMNNFNPKQMPSMLPNAFSSNSTNFFSSRTSPKSSENGPGVDRCGSIVEDAEILCGLKSKGEISTRKKASSLQAAAVVLKDKIDLSEFKVKEYITVTNIVRDGFTQQLRRSGSVSSLSYMISNLDRLTDEEMDMKNYDVIKMGILTEKECARRYEIFKTKMMHLPQVKSVCSLIMDLGWFEFKEKYPKLFLTLISSTSMVDVKNSVAEFDALACYKLSEATLKMFFFYCKRKKLKTLEMYLCVNIIVVWDNIYQGMIWKDYKALISIFQDYLSTITETNIPVSAFINGEVDISIDTDLTQKILPKSVGKCFNSAFDSVLLTDEKRLEFPEVSIILELSCFHLTFLLGGSSAGELITEFPAYATYNNTLIEYCDSLKNSTSIYHQNLHLMATITHDFMAAMQSNSIYKDMLFEDLIKSEYLDVVGKQISSLNSYVYLISADNKKLRLCLHSMKAQMLEILIESLNLSYAKVRHDPIRAGAFFESIDDSIINEINNVLVYSFDCINELDKISDDFLVILPACYLSRFSICFDIILKMLHLTLANSKKFEAINQTILEFSLKNITITYRCAKLLEKYPCNTIILRLQTLCTHAYFVEIKYWKKAITENQYFINTKDFRLLAAINDFEGGYQSCEHMASILFKHSESFFLSLEWTDK